MNEQRLSIEGHNDKEIRLLGKCILTLLSRYLLVYSGTRMLGDKFGLGRSIVSRVTKPHIDCD